MARSVDAETIKGDDRTIYRSSPRGSGREIFLLIDSSVTTFATYLVAQDEPAEAVIDPGAKVVWSWGCSLLSRLLLREVAHC
jgi:hypothetical protein